MLLYHILLRCLFKLLTMASNSTLWMGDLEPYMDERFICQAFEQMGEAVVRVKFVSSKQARGSAGYCFIEFSNAEAANNAMLRLNSKVIPGSAPPSRFKLNNASFGREHLAAQEFSLFVGDITDDIDDFKLYSMFSSKYSSCKSAKVVLDASGTSRKYGFVRFTNEADQQRALIEMQGYVGINKRPLRISMAIPKRPGAVLASNISAGSYPPTIPYCYYQQQYYTSYQPYYANTGQDYVSPWWLAYQQPTSSSMYYDYGQYAGGDGSYFSTEQNHYVTAADTLASEMDTTRLTEKQIKVDEDDGETLIGWQPAYSSSSHPVPMVDVQQFNKAYFETSEEFYTALEGSRWHPLDNVLSSIMPNVN